MCPSAAQTRSYSREPAIKEQAITEQVLIGTSLRGRPEHTHLNSPAAQEGSAAQSSARLLLNATGGRGSVAGRAWNGVSRLLTFVPSVSCPWLGKRESKECLSVPELEEPVE